MKKNMLIFNFALTAILLVFNSNALCSSPIYKSEFIFSMNTFPSVHGSTIVEIEKNHLLACWFGGSREGGKDVKILCSRNKNQKWSKPFVAVKDREKLKGYFIRNKFVGNPTLYLDHDQVLWMFYEVTLFGGHALANVAYKQSHDFGKNWTKGKLFKGGIFSPGFLPRNKPLSLDHLNQNQFMVPIYSEIFKYGHAVMLETKNGKVINRNEYRIPGKGHLQPTIVQTSDNKIRAFLRNYKRKNILTSSFDIRNKKWSAPVPTNLPNPNAAVDSVTDSNGNILIVYNASYRGRNILSLAISKDGVNFKKIYDFENEPSGKFSYPAIIKSKDGNYHVTYTYLRKSIKYVEFNEAWLDELI